MEESASHAFLFIVIARSRICDQGWQNAYKSGLPSAAIFLFYIYIIRCHRYLHANFQEDLPQKKTQNFSFENLLHCFWRTLYYVVETIFFSETISQ